MEVPARSACVRVASCALADRDRLPLIEGATAHRHAAHNTPHDFIIASVALIYGAHPWRKTEKGTLTR